MLGSSPMLLHHAGNFLYSGDLVINGSVIDTAKDLPGLQEQCLNLFTKHHLNAYISPEVCLHGHTYKPGIILQLNYVEGGVPTFGLVLQNLIHDTMKFFILENLITSEFDGHYIIMHMF